MTHQGQARKHRFKVRYIIWMALLAGLVAFGVFRFHAHHQLQQRIEGLRAQGYPMSPVEMDAWHAESREDLDDAWPLFLDAFSAYVEWDDEAQEKLPGYGDERVYGRGQAWTPLHLQEAQAFLADNKECLDLLYEGADIGYSFCPLDFSLGYKMKLPPLGETRSCAWLLRLASRVAAQQGDVDEAIKAIRAIFVLTDSLQAPMTINTLVQRANCQVGFHAIEDLLSLHNLTLDHIQALEALLEPMESIERFKQSLVGERCSALSAFEASAQEAVMLSSSGSENNRLPLLIVPRKILGLHDRDALSYINLTQAHIEATSLPRHETRVRINEVAEEYENRLGMLTRILMPAFRYIYRAESQTVTSSRCARAALAVERHRMATGQLPETLEKLVPTFMASVPMDPFDGQPLRFRHLDKGYVVYSVGQDLTDNHGEERRPRRARKGQKTWDETFTVAR